MSFPVYQNSGTIATVHYNDIFNQVYDIIGPGENGFGLQDYFMNPVTTNELILATHVRDLQTDLVITAYNNIYASTSTLTDAIVAGGPIQIQADFMNRAWDVLNTHVVPNRHICAEPNFFRDPTTGVSTNTTGGTSSRTIEWGVTENYITHVVKSVWSTRLAARYFFNGGGYFTWTPYHSDDGQNDIDAEWAEFIRQIQIEQGDNFISEPGALVYDRTKFDNHTPGTSIRLYPNGSSRSFPDPTYEQGTLLIDVNVVKSLSEEQLEFTITFRNSDSATLIVTPTVGYWNVNV
jgi:hypothetical protein